MGGFFMEKLSVKMQKMILWITSFTNIVAFVLCGGYILRFGADEDVKKTAVHAFVLNAIFLIINNMVLPLVTLFAAEFGGRGVVEWLDTSDGHIVILLLVARIAVYAGCMIQTLREKTQKNDTF